MRCAPHPGAHLVKNDQRRLPLTVFLLLFRPGFALARDTRIMASPDRARRKVTLSPGRAPIRLRTGVGMRPRVRPLSSMTLDLYSSFTFFISNILCRYDLWAYARAVA